MNLDAIRATANPEDLPPPILYMYCSEPTKRNGITNLLRDRRIRTSEFGNLNDPFDFMPVTPLNSSRSEIRHVFSSRPEMWPPGFKGTIDEAVEMTKERLDKGARNPRKFWTEVASSKRVICMSERNDGVLMWSHYASSHRGFAVGFREKEIWLASPRIFFHEVTYGGRRPHYSVAKMLLGREAKFELFLRLMVQKSKEWKYEKEWRSIVDLPDLKAEGQFAYLPFTRDAVESVILGPDIQPATLRKLTIACRKGDLPSTVKVYRTKLCRVSYRIIVDKTPRLLGERGVWKPAS